jgi:hypothetical protein
MTRRLVNATAALAAAVLLGAWATPAGAAQARVRPICVTRSTVMSTPGGLVVGFLARGTPVIVVRRTRDGRWADMRAVHTVYGWVVGWIHTKDLC